MARDSQAALVALNRFGFGARGGASGDFVNAAIDPRGFVKAELGGADRGRLEAPGLLATPALAGTVFAYQDEVKAAREAAAKSGISAPEAAGSQAAADVKMPDSKMPDDKMQSANAPAPNGVMAPSAPKQPV